ncbi:RHS repeat-associated protein [Stenotrophomonas rhizophila]|uniref:RHS repeat-associated protein n=2 Tax=Stenotrophomonas rhizophila TaxID=216778 RepID=A0AAP5EFB6_9GAMM|nr:RHS repeat-associated protein [Stenotrophomonas rhizophila]
MNELKRACLAVMLIGSASERRRVPEVSSAVRAGTRRLPHRIMSVSKVINTLMRGWLILSLAAGPLQTAGAQESVEYIHTDALGSPVAVSDTNGNVIKRTVYEPYGAVGGGVVEDGPGYTGHVSDSATGLSYMQQRYYDPQSGRFLSVDPVTTDQNGAGNFGRYKYGNNNPYRFVDPDGRQERAAERFSDAFAGNPEAFEPLRPVAIAVTAVALGATPLVGPIAGVSFRKVVKESPTPEGTAGGPRSGKDFTRAGKREVIRQNKDANGGQTTCQGCGASTTPATQSQRGVPTPKNETRVDHIIPKAKGGDGAPSNGQVLCSQCNLEKGSKSEWVPPKERLP